MKCLARSFMWWPNINKEPRSRTTVKDYLPCQQTRNLHKVRVGLPPIRVKPSKTDTSDLAITERWSLSRGLICYTLETRLLLYTRCMSFIEGLLYTNTYTVY